MRRRPRRPGLHSSDQPRQRAADAGLVARDGFHFFRRHHEHHGRPGRVRRGVEPQAQHGPEMGRQSGREAVRLPLEAGRGLDGRKAGDGGRLRVRLAAAPRSEDRVGVRLLPLRRRGGGGFQRGEEQRPGERRHPGAFFHAARSAPAEARRVLPFARHVFRDFSAAPGRRGETRRPLDGTGEHRHERSVQPRPLGTRVQDRDRP